MTDCVSAPQNNEPLESCMRDYKSLPPNDKMAAARGHNFADKIDPKNQRFPYCIVWTPIPLLTWFFPFIGHMGIGTSEGVIRDFAGPYYVSEGDMHFGEPTRYLRLQPQHAENGVMGWDVSIGEASNIYSQRVHNLFCDNCHSHVATALELMNYRGTRWNMFKLAGWMFTSGKYVNTGGLLKTWLPFAILVAAIVCLILVLNYSKELYSFGY